MERPKGMTEKEAAAFLGLSRQTLANWRSTRRGPDYLKCGRAVRYLVEDIQAYIEAHRIRPEKSGR